MEKNEFIESLKIAGIDITYQNYLVVREAVSKMTENFPSEAASALN